MTGHYVHLVGPYVVAKRAVGPNPDGSMPSVPGAWVPVSPAVYRQVEAGWRRRPNGTWREPEPKGDEGDPIRPDTPRERRWRKEARLRVKLLELEARIEALEQA